MNATIEAEPLRVSIGPSPIPEWWDLGKWPALLDPCREPPRAASVGVIGIRREEQTALAQFPWVAGVLALDHPARAASACEVIFAHERTGSAAALDGLLARAAQQLAANGRLVLSVVPRYAGVAAAAPARMAASLGISPRADWQARLRQIARTLRPDHPALTSLAEPDGATAVDDRYNLAAAVAGARAARLRLVRFVHPRAYDLAALLSAHPALLDGLPAGEAERLVMAECLQPWLAAHEMIFAPEAAPSAPIDWAPTQARRLAAVRCPWTVCDLHGPQAKTYAHLRAETGFFPHPIALSAPEHRFVTQLDGERDLAGVAFDAALGLPAACELTEKLHGAGLVLMRTPAAALTPAKLPASHPARIPYEECPLCGATGSKPHRTAGCRQHPLYRGGLPEVMEWRRCEACGHVFTSGYFNDAALELLFSGSHGHQLAGHQTERQREICGRIVSRLASTLGSASGRWLDVGFGGGDLLATASEFGFDAVGVDVRAQAVEALGRLGYQAHCSTFTSFASPEKFDVISLADVLEHIPLPHSALAHAASLLHAGGLIFVSSPNSDTLVWRQLDQQQSNPYWAEIEHYHNFTRESLQRALRHAGFAPVEYAVSERYRTGMEIIGRLG